MLKARNPTALREVLNQWEKGSIAPLSQGQQEAITDLAAYGDRPLPDLVCLFKTILYTTFIFRD